MEGDLLRVHRAQAREDLAWVLPRADAICCKAEDGHAGQPGGQVLFDLPLCLLSLKKTLIIAGLSACYTD